MPPPAYSCTKAAVTGMIGATMTGDARAATTTGITTTTTVLIATTTVTADAATWRAAEVGRKQNTISAPAGPCAWRSRLTLITGRGAACGRDHHANENRASSMVGRRCGYIRTP